MPSQDGIRAESPTLEPFDPAYYRPCYRANDDAALARRPAPAELRAALEAARRHGLARLDPGGVA